MTHRSTRGLVLWVTGVVFSVFPAGGHAGIPESPAQTTGLTPMSSCQDPALGPPQPPINTLYQMGMAYRTLVLGTPLGHGDEAATEQRSLAMGVAHARIHLAEREAQIARMEGRARLQALELSRHRELLIAALVIGLLLGALALISVRSWARSKRQNASSAAALREKETLLGELTHRVKNNLQVVESLVNLELRRLAPSTGGPGGAAKVLRDVLGRLQTMTLVHDELHRKATGPAVASDQLLEGLTHKMVTIFGVDVTLGVELERHSLLPRQAVPLGLIACELISNALEHALTKADEGHLKVVFEVVGFGARLTVEDNGMGLPEDFCLEGASSLGLTLVQDLTNKLPGTLSVHLGEGGSGTRWVLDFDLDRDPPIEGFRD